MDQFSDEDLLSKAKGADRKAFDQLYERHKRRILSFVYRMVNDRVLAEDLTQETFIRVYMHMDSFEPTGKVLSWIFTIARNLTKNALRDNKRRFDKSLDETVFGDEEEVKLEDLIPSAVPGPDKEYDRKELAARIDASLEAMKPEYKEVLILCDIEGLSYDEAAKVIGVHKGSVASRLFRARGLFIRLFGRISVGKK